MQPSVHLQRVVLVLAVLATALTQSVLADRQPHGGAALLTVTVALSIGLAIVSRRLAWQDWTAQAVGSALAIGLLPVAWDAVGRILAGIGAPYEVQLVYVLRNAMLALAALGHLPRAAPQAALASFFLVAFTFLWSSGPWAVALLVAYALVGAWWLLAAYWERLGGRFADASENALPVRPAVASVLMVALLCLGALPLVGRSATTSALSGFFPSSGGTGDNDPFAHGGVGDGDQLVAAKEHASSFGPIESELFLESKMPSLYDAFNEFSEAPPLKTKRLRRSIPLGMSQIQSNHEKRGISQQASREFTTVRRAKAKDSRPKDLLSAALLLVKGRTPMHLGLETYDHWDGHTLSAVVDTEPIATRLRDSKDARGRRWLDFSILPPTDAYAVSADTQVRVVNLKTDRVPLPATATRVTMQGLHAAGLFELSANGCLAMDVEHVPQLTIFEFRSMLRDRGAPLQLMQTASGSAQDSIAGLAREWTQGVAAGWPQVDAVVSRLRNEYIHDRAAMAPEEAEDAVEHFLFEARRGPDYLFATSAAVLLRSLGFDTRVRSGFYVDPERFNHAAQLTPVTIEDAHFWVEVRTSNGNRVSASGDLSPGIWATVEPTPGYELRYAPETLGAQLLRHARALVAAIVSRPVTVVSSVVLVAVMWLVRRRVFDALVINWWWLRSRTVGGAQLARLTLRLVQWRAWAYRQRRPRGATVASWKAIAQHREFTELVSWALYGEGTPAPYGSDAARVACRDAICTRLAVVGPIGSRPPQRRYSRATGYEHR